jgi:hypothetical protein
MTARTAVLVLLLLNIGVEAVPMSRALTGAHQHLVQCIKSITARYFNPHRTVLMSLPGRSISQRRFSDLELYLARELHAVGRWSVVLSNRTGRMIDRSDYMKHGSYILFVCWKAANAVSEVTADFNKHLQSLKNTSSWNPEARFLVVILQDHASCYSAVLVRSLLQQLWHFKVMNSVILAQICERGDLKVRERLSELSSTEIPHSTHQECNGPGPETERDNASATNKTAAVWTVKQVVFALYTWVPYRSPDKCAQVVDITELDLWSSQGHGGFLYNYPLFPQKISGDLQGCSISILASEYPPFLVSAQQVKHNTPNSLAFQEGPITRLLTVLSTKMNMTQNITAVLAERVYPELYTRITDGNFDLIFSPVSLLHFGRNLLDETYVLSQKRGRFVVPCGQTLPRWNSVIRVFSPTLWLTVFLSMIMAAMLMLYLTGCLNKLSQSEYQVYQSLPSCLISMWAVLLGSSVAVMPRSGVFRVFFSAWLLHCLAVNTVFQAFLTTFITNPGREHQADSIQEILDSGLPYGFDPQCDKGFRETGDSIMMTILQHRIPCSPYTTCMDWVAFHRNFSTPSTDNIVDYFTATKYVDYQGQPLLCAVKEEYYTSNNVLHLMKGNPLLQRVNELVGRIVQSGIFSQWTKELLDSLKLKKGVISLRTLQDEYHSFSLKNMQSAFWVLCVGWALGAAVFVAQLCLQSGKYPSSN